jgi:hypothetical protein
MKNQPTIAQFHHLTGVFPEVNLENSAAGTVCSATVNRNLWFENRSVARCCARVAVMRALNIATRTPSAVAENVLMNLFAPPTDGSQRARHLRVDRA